MKKALIVLVMLAMLPLLTWSQVKIGLINPEKVISDSLRGKEVQQKLQAFGENKQKTIEGLEREIRNLESEINTKRMTWNQETLEKRMTEVQSKQTQHKRIVEDAQRDFQREYQKEMTQLQRELMPIIEEFGKTHGYTIILDLSTAGVSYFSAGIDVTEEIIKIYDTKYKK